ncbi:MAG: phosphoglucosamine mutase [Acidobacteriota bacterium]|nr:phosphoglucosamine mutase [Acidobacteriota bacterium]
MKKTLFGTDGIRAVAGAYPLDEASLLKLGAVISAQAPAPRVLIGRDTRESGPVIEALLARGLGRQARVFSAGVLPTPGLAFLTREHGYDFGVMISASHNPFSDNGIKLFDRRGEKASAAQEDRISREFFLCRRAPDPPPRPTAAQDTGAYAGFLMSEGKGLVEAGAKIAVDCANGAASRLAPSLLRRLGLEIAVGHTSPNGRNINSGCGSTSPAALQKLVGKSRSALGLAFDGDADRVIFADARGRIIEGDHVLFLLARYLRDREPRFRPVVVGTVMSNLGLERALQRAGIRFLRADVGDKHVYRLMKRSGAILGGEPSGHIILRHRQTSGDGLLTALHVMRALRHFGSDAEAAFDGIALYPQKTLSIRVCRRPPLKDWQAFQRESIRFTRRYGKEARLLARYSGTEPKLRIMIESRDQETIDKNMPIFQSLVENELGE